MKDIAIILENRPGALADMGEVLGKNGINMEGLCGIPFNEGAVVHILVEDETVTRYVLESAGFKVSAVRDVLIMDIGRIELGMLPSIIDTIIFIEGGDISAVLTLKMTVKVPHGFRDKDLARPVVEVRDFKTDRLAYEIYSFGQDIVINPINPIGLKDSFKTQEHYKGRQPTKKGKE
ncbi:unnamed protein product, partial [marine sediment metagenome]